MHMPRDRARKLARELAESEERPQVLFQIPKGWDTCSLEWARKYRIVYDEIIEPIGGTNGNSRR